MPKRVPLLFALILLAGCKKDEATPALKVAQEPPQTRQESSSSDVKKQEPPKKEPEARTKLGTLDLRAYGIAGVIDAPPGARVVRKEKESEVTIDGADGYALTLTSGMFDLAREYAEIKAQEGNRLKAKPVDDKDALILEIEENGKTRYMMLANVTVADQMFSVLSADIDASLPQMLRNLQAARSLRQTPEMKAAAQRRESALMQLLGGPHHVVTSKTGEMTVIIDGSSPAYEETLKLVVELPEVTSLTLRGTSKFTDEHIATLAKLPRLRELSLQGKWVNRRIVEALQDLPKLVALDLKQATLDDGALGPLAAIKELRHLSLSETRVADIGVKRLAELKNLESLDLSNTNVTSAGLPHFKLFQNLKELNLSDTALSDASLADLAAVSTLRKINLAMTPIGDKGIEVFATFAGPLTLDLYGSDATLEGIAKLTKANDKIAVNSNWLVEPEPKPVMPPVAIDKLPAADPAALAARFGGKITRDEEAADKPITAIDLSGSKVTDADLGHLRTASKLQKLILARCSEITDAGLPYLAGLTALEELNLAGTQIKGDGLVHLKDLKNLAQLTLPTTARFTGRQLAPVVSLPNLEVLSLKLPSADCFLVLRTMAKVAKLKEINFTDVALTNRHLEHLKNLKSLESLTLSRSERLSDRGLSHLKGLENLKTLIIPSFSGTNFGLESLRGLTNLRILELYGENLGDGGMPAVGALHNLERLRLDRLKIGDTGILSLRSIGKPIEFSLGGTNVTDKGVASIAEHKEIEYVDLSYTKITDAGLEKFQGLEELRGLRLDGTALTGKGFEALATLPRFNRVSLQDTKVDDAGAASLARVSRLRAINLSGNAITNAALAELKQLRLLEELDLDRCVKLTDEAVNFLKTYPALKRASLKGTMLTAKAIEDLRKSGVKVDFEAKP